MREMVPLMKSRFSLFWKRSNAMLCPITISNPGLVFQNQTFIYFRDVSQLLTDLLVFTTFCLFYGYV